MNAGEIVSVYIRIILEFLLELYVFYALMTARLKKSARFYPAFIGGAAAMAAIGFGAAAFYCVLGDTVWGRIGVYLVLFLISTGHIMLCFDEPRLSVLFCCSTAYAAQNLTYKVFLFFWCIGEQLRLYDGWGDKFELVYRIVYYAFIAVAAAAAYFLYIRPLSERLSGGEINLRMLVISVVILVVTVIMCSFEDVYFACLSPSRENSYDYFPYFVLRETGNAFSVLSCAVVLIIVSRTVECRDLKAENEYLGYEIRQKERQYEISRDTIERINLKCHDMKYRINSAVRDALPLSEAGDLCESISIYDTKVSTGNKLLDVLLTDKSLYCEQHGITFSCMADGAKLSFISDGDLYCLFGNIADNAMEAAAKITQPEKRIINLSVKEKNGLLLIQQENYFEGALDFRDGLPQTTKNDRSYHGFGMRSVRMLVHKYGGELTVSAKDGVFGLSIIFVIPE